jgi:hypothetical protein
MIQTMQICTNHSEKITMNTAINLLSVIPMRKEPSHRSEMVSQLLFGEYAEMLEEDEHFVRVKCLYDDYEGWVQANQLTPVEKVLLTETYIGCRVAEVMVNRSSIHVPMCSPIYTSNDVIHFSQTEVGFPSNTKCNWNSRENKFTKQALEAIYKKFENTPYLWGGKSVFGIDCSGFVQQVFKMFGIKLLRDAYLQAGQGTSVESLDQSQSGDLAFFQNENGRVIHVGMILENNQIVHAAGKVRIDTIDEKGIVNRETGKRTHHLHSMRRYF